MMKEGNPVKIGGIFFLQSSNYDNFDLSQPETLLSLIGWNIDIVWCSTVLFYVWYWSYWCSASSWFRFCDLFCLRYIISIDHSMHLVKGWCDEGKLKLFRKNLLTCFDRVAERFSHSCWCAPHVHAWSIVAYAEMLAYSSSTECIRAIDKHIPLHQLVDWHSVFERDPFLRLCNGRNNPLDPRIASRIWPNNIRISAKLNCIR